MRAKKHALIRLAIEMKWILLLLWLVVSLTSIACGLRSQYGLLAIKSPTGKSLYFRREVKGPNYDALSLSETTDYCADPNPNTSLLFRSLDHTVFYKFVGNELHLYTMSSVQSPPQFSTEVPVIVHNITNQEFMEMNKNYRDKGVELVDVPIDKSLWCYPLIFQ